MLTVFENGEWSTTFKSLNLPFPSKTAQSVHSFPNLSHTLQSPASVQNILPLSQTLQSQSKMKKMLSSHTSKMKQVLSVQSSKRIVTHDDREFWRKFSLRTYSAYKLMYKNSFESGFMLCLYSISDVISSVKHQCLSMRHTDYIKKFVTLNIAPNTAMETLIEKLVHWRYTLRFTRQKEIVNDYISDILLYFDYGQNFLDRIQ